MPSKLGTVTTASSVGHVTSLSVSIAVPAGTNRCLVLEYSGWGPTASKTDHSVKWNGISLTKIGRASFFGLANYTFGGLFYLPEALLTTATASLVITSPLAATLRVGVRTWGSANQVIPWGEFVGDYATFPPTSQPNVTCTTIAGAEVIDALTVYSSVAYSMAPTYTAEWSMVTSADLSYGSSSRTATTDETPIAWVMSPSMSVASSDSWVYGAASLNPLVLITWQPTSQQANVGDTATFTVTVTNATSHQWQDNSSGSFANVTAGTGATTETYTTATITAGMDGRAYRCVINGTLNSNSATLNLLLPGSLAQFDPELRATAWF